MQMLFERSSLANKGRIGANESILTTMKHLYTNEWIFSVNEQRKVSNFFDS